MPGSPGLVAKVKARLGELCHGCNTATLLYAYMYHNLAADATLCKGMIQCPALSIRRVDHSMAVQEEALLRFPALLTLLLNMVLLQNWLQMTITVVRLDVTLS
jgi:hypothetical protein